MTAYTGSKPATGFVLNNNSYYIYSSRRDVYTAATVKTEQIIALPKMTGQLYPRGDK